MALDRSILPDGLSVRVVVAFRNEEACLPLLLSSLSRQSFPFFELVLVDDHSDDDGLVLAERFASHFPSSAVLRSDGVGKKAALRKGIAHVGSAVSSSDVLIVTTDADCVVPDGWVEAVVRSFISSATHFLIGPVRLRGSSFQALEWMSLQAVTRLTALYFYPVLCNGANLAFRRSEFLRFCDSSSILGSQCASGDDVFLLQTFRRFRLPVTYLNSRFGIVDTFAPSSISSFFRQRFRWVRKTKSFHMSFSLFLAGGVLCLCIIMILMLFLDLRCYLFLNLSLLVFELPLFLRQAWWFCQWTSLLWLPVWQLLYPFYVLFCTLGGWIVAPRWKGRIVRNG